jgi:arsenite-transporting ATPase
VYTGKGGVGKTTVSASTALACAAAGHRTLVTSTDPAHSLGDALGLSLGSEPTEVAPNCFAQEVNARARMEAGWGDIRGYLSDLLAWSGADRVEASELAVLPGLEEVLALGGIYELATAGDWDVVVVDCAPTAETIRLLSLPEVLSWYMDKAFPLSRRLSRLVSPVLSRFSEIPVADERVFSSAERLYGQLTKIRELLTEAGGACLRLVVTPEQMVIAEARRTYTYLSMFGYSLDSIVVNRLVPERFNEPFLARWRDQQRRGMELIEESFSPLPIHTCELLDAEAIGVGPLRGVAEDLYGGHDPAVCAAAAPPLQIRSSASGAELVLALPHAEREELSVAAADGDLIVTYGPYRRRIALPDSLLGAAVTGARLGDDGLVVSLTTTV